MSKDTITQLPDPSGVAADPLTVEGLIASVQFVSDRKWRKVAAGFEFSGKLNQSPLFHAALARASAPINGRSGLFCRYRNPGSHWQGCAGVILSDFHHQFPCEVFLAEDLGQIRTR